MLQPLSWNTKVQSAPVVPPRATESGEPPAPADEVVLNAGRQEPVSGGNTVTVSWSASSQQPVEGTVTLATSGMTVSATGIELTQPVAVTVNGVEVKPTQWGSLLMEDGLSAVKGASAAFTAMSQFGFQKPVQEVVVVGGGPGGLAAAIELAERGIKARVIEVRSADYQRPHHLNARMSTLHSFEDYGIYEDVKEASGFSEELSPMKGRALKNGPQVIQSESVAQVRISDVEKALYKRAMELGVEYIPHHRVVMGEPDENGMYSVRLEQVEVVDGRVVGTGKLSEVLHPDLVIGADGAGSPTRAALGIGLVDESDPRIYLGGLVEKPLSPEGGYVRVACMEGEELRHYMATGHKKYPQTWVSVEAGEGVKSLSPEERTDYLAQRASAVMGFRVKPEDISWGAGQITVVQNRRAERTVAGNNVVFIGDAVRTGSVWQSGGLNLALTSDISNLVRLVDNINMRSHSREHALYEYNLRANHATRAWHQAGQAELNGTTEAISTFIPADHPVSTLGST